MALAAKLGPLADADGRQVERNRLRLDASLGQADASTAIDVVLHDLSVQGFLAQTDAALPIGSKVWLDLAGVGRLAARIRWRGSSTLGCEFERAISPEALAAAIKESPVVWPNFPANRTAERAPAAPADPAAKVAREPEEHDGRWPIRHRAMFILGSAILLWLIVILVVRTLWAAVA